MHNCSLDVRPSVRLAGWVGIGSELRGPAGRTRTASLTVLLFELQLGAGRQASRNRRHAADRQTVGSNQNRVDSL